MFYNVTRLIKYVSKRAAREAYRETQRDDIKVQVKHVFVELCTLIST